MRAWVTAKVSQEGPGETGQCNEWIKDLTTRNGELE